MSTSRVLSLPFLVLSFAFVQDDGDSLVVRRIEKLAERTVAEGGMAGVSLAVGVGDDVLFSDGFGTVRERVQAAEDTTYRITSLADHFLVAVVLRLVEAGRLDLTGDVAAHFEALDFDGETVTLHQVLAHASGLPDFSDVVPDEASHEAILKWIAGSGFEFPPGTCYDYSATNTFLLGALAEKVAGKPVDELVAELFETCQLEDTVYDADEPAPVPSAEVGEELGGEWRRAGRGHSVFRGDELASNAVDLLGWLRALRGGTVLRSLYPRMYGPAMLADGSDSPAGYGVNVTRMGDVSGWSHGGTAAGYDVYLAYYPEVELSIVALGAGGGARIGDLGREVARVVLDVPAQGRADEVLEEDERARYVGVYKAGCDRMEIREADERLVLHCVDREPVVLLYQGRHLFVGRSDDGIRVTFLVEDDDERAHSFLFDDHGIQWLATRFE